MSAHRQRAWMLIEQGRYDLAMEEVRQALGEDPDDGTLHAMMALCLSERGRTDEALHQAERAVHLSPDDWWVQYVLATTLTELERWDAALAQAEQAAALNPGATAPHTLIGQIHLRKSRWRDALASADHALALNPSDTTAANVRAVALTQLGDRDAAAQTIDGSLERDPQNATTHANRGWALLHAGKPHEAMEHFAEALRLEPDNEWARTGIVEAMKARNVVYRTFLRIVLRLSRIPPRTRLIAIVGVIVLLQIMLRLPDEGPIFYTALVLGALYALFVVFMWSAGPLFDLLLMLDRFGRMALNRHEKRAAAVYGAALVASATFIGTAALPQGRMGDLVDYILLTMAAGVGASVPAYGRWKLGFALVAGLYALAAMYWYGTLTFDWPFEPGAADAWFRSPTTTDAQRKAVLDHVELQQNTNQLFVWGAILMTWASTWLHQRVRR